MTIKGYGLPVMATVNVLDPPDSFIQTKVLSNVELTTNWWLDSWNWLEWQHRC